MLGYWVVSLKTGSRVGKFDLEEIKILLQNSGFTENQEKRIIKNFEKDVREKNKKSFRSAVIKDKISYVPKPKIDKKLRDDFIEKLQTKLWEKLSSNSVNFFLKNRNIDESKAEYLDSKPVDREYINSILEIAYARDDYDLIEVIVINNPDFFGSNDNKIVAIDILEGAIKYTTLKNSPALGNTDIIQKLIHTGILANMDKENWDDVLEIISENKSDPNIDQFINTKVEKILLDAKNKADFSADLNEEKKELDPVTVHINKLEITSSSAEPLKTETSKEKETTK